MNESSELTYTSQQQSDHECAEFQALMPERIAAGEDLKEYPHMQTCTRCPALIAELEQIATVVREMFAKDEDELELPDTLWSKIEQKTREEAAGAAGTPIGDEKPAVGEKSILDEEPLPGGNLAAAAE